MVNSSNDLQINMKVETNYRGKGTWYPGKVHKMHENGTYDIDYDDGEKEINVLRELIRPIVTANLSDLQVGVKVEGNYKGRGRWYPGKIVKVSNDAFDISYDDGEEEIGVKTDFIKLAQAPAVVTLDGKQEGAGARIEGNFRGRGRWYPGVVGKIHPNGTIDILYDDGEEEKSVPAVLVRYTAPLTTQNTTPAGTTHNFKVDDKVEGNYRGKGKWYPGKVKQVRADGTLDIDYDDGEVETRLTAEFVRLLGAPVVVASTAGNGGASYNEGDRVEGNYRGKGKWYPGKVKQVRADGTLDIDYDDGEKETRVSADFVRLVGAPVKASPVSDLTTASVIRSGDKVEGNYRGKGKWYPGKVSRVREDGTVDLVYDDGETETRVAAEFVRLLGAPIAVATAIDETVLSDFKVGDKIEGNYRGKGTWFPGHIGKVKADGTVDIDYDDGEVERDRSVELVRHVVTHTASAVAIESPVSAVVVVGGFKAGDKIEGNYRGKGKWYSGKVSTVRADGTVDIDYDDGEKETRLTAEFVRLLNVPAVASVSSGNGGASYKEGDKIEGNYRGKGKWYPGRVSAIREDGTVDLEYDDGEKETRVSAEFVRLVNAPVATSASVDSGGATCKEGDKIEGNYRGKGKWYPGRVKNVRADGTVDIDYDDGEVETRVAAEFVRLVGVPASSDLITSAGIRAGDKIEGNYRGKGKWYPGRVKNVRADGTLDIDYDDGEVETRLVAELVRLMGAPIAVASAVLKAVVIALKVGDRVEGNYRCKGKWYPGKVSQVREDGTIDLEYDDGEVETGVEPDLARRIGGGASTRNARSPPRVRDPPADNQDATCKEGDKIEGNYRGKGKWYPGKVKQVRADGTIDIDYDDGEKETRLTAEFVRLVNAPVKASPVSDLTTASGIRSGDKVEGNYRGKGKWYPGKVSRVGEDDTVDLVYDDGETETRVAAEFVRLTTVSHQRQASPLTLETDNDRIPYTVGSRVVANYLGNGTWLPGKIVKVHSNAAYDINYDNGEFEKAVTLVNVRAIGYRVEGNFESRGRWYPAKISFDHGDGTVDLHYDDGTNEKNVTADNFRLVNSNHSPDSALPSSNRSAALSKADSTEHLLAGTEILHAASFPIGSKVEGNYRGKGKWYPAVVRAVHTDNTVDIDYDDGEDEREVKLEFVRLLNIPTAATTNATAASTAVQFNANDKIEGNYRGKGKWYPGRVKQVRADGTVDIDYDDGEVETRLTAELVRLVGAPITAATSTPNGSSSYNENDKVEGNYRGKGKWYPGRVSAVRADGTVDLEYDDGEKETRVAAEFVRLVGAPVVTPASADNGGATCKEGDKIEGNYRGKGKWYPGRVKQVRADGTVDIDYDDGEVETRLTAAFVRLVGAPVAAAYNASTASSYKVGDKVEGNYRGKGKWYPGRIVQVRADGRVDIDYDDGEAETRVSAELVRFVESQPVSAVLDSAENIVVGTNVMKLQVVRIECGELQYPHVTQAYHSFVSIQLGSVIQKTAFLNGVPGASMESNIIFENTTLTFDLSDDLPDSAALAVKVFCDDKTATARKESLLGETSYLLSKLATNSESAKLALLDTNGKTCGKVVLHFKLIEPTELTSAFKAGDKIEGNYRGKGKWYPGKVKQVGADGAVDIDYDDGEVETRLTADLVRLVGAPKKSEPVVPTLGLSKPGLTTGTKIEANYRGMGKYFPGRVTKNNGDGTFDVDYDDGESETKVKEQFLRLPGEAQVSPRLEKSPRKPIYDEGTRVQANYKGKGLWFAGKIKKDRGDGTYDVEYDDGESEARVLNDHIRPVDTSVRISPGTKIEANYRSRGQWFAGKISKDHLNGTFDVDYDDGESETGVISNNIRLQETFVVPANPVKVPGYDIGVKVEANYMGKGTWYPGKITLDRGDRTFDVTYEDGEFESKVSQDCIRLLNPPSTTPTTGLKSGIANTFSTDNLNAIQQPLSASELTALRKLLSGAAATSPQQEDLTSSRTGNSLQNALKTSKQLELEAMSLEIASLQTKNIAVTEQLRILTEEVNAMKLREIEMKTVIATLTLKQN